ncbi:unnamed protein product [Ectocarpus sp. 12 AP-2014]
MLLFFFKLFEHLPLRVWWQVRSGDSFCGTLGAFTRSWAMYPFCPRPRYLVGVHAWPMTQALSVGVYFCLLLCAFALLVGQRVSGLDPLASRSKFSIFPALLIADK